MVTKVELWVIVLLAAPGPAGLVAFGAAVLDDHRIGVFNNNAYDEGKGARVHGVNQITVHDFSNGTSSSPWQKAFEGAEVLTLCEGLFDQSPDGVAMIGEENSGRLLFAPTDGTTLAEFINKAKDGNAYRMGWRRYMSQADGGAALANLGGACSGG